MNTLDTRISTTGDSGITAIRGSRDIRGISSLEDSDLIGTIRNQSGLAPISALGDISEARKIFHTLNPSLESVIEEDKAKLRLLCDQGQILGQRANDARTEICKLKESLHALQETSSLHCNTLSRDAVSDLLKRVEEERRKYEDALGSLRETKDEITRLKAHIRDTRSRISELFAVWVEHSRKAIGYAAN